MEQPMLELVGSVDFQEFLFSNEGIDERKLVLKHKSLFNIPSSIIANQISGRRKAKEKMPSWYSTRGIVYPPSINMEQCSSERTAIFKREIIQTEVNKVGLTGADLTGGLGIDSFFLSNICTCLFYVEKEHSVFNLAKHNHTVLSGGQIQHVQQRAEEFINSIKQHFDFIYIDPSRRLGQTKVFKLSDCEPSVSPLLPALFKHTSLVLIKASPLLDLQQAMHELKCVNKVYVVSVDNECKELLFMCNPQFIGEPFIYCINLPKKEAFLTFTFSEERSSTVRFSEPLTYLYEPNASILKAGAFKFIANQFNFLKLHAHTHLYTSVDFIERFPGRVFKIEMVNPKSNDLKRFFPDGKANVITRNYPLSSEELKSKLKLKDGGELFLFGVTSTIKLLLIARRLR
jgi:16S rRNA G966 N2-methylase RsmD